MIHTEREFFETAVARSRFYNQSALVRELGIGDGTFSDWKKGRSYPSDKTMLKIALLCDLDPVEALALLNLWRCDDAARGTYARLLDLAQSTALKCFPYIIGLALAFQGNDANALEYKENISPEFLIITQSDDYAILKETRAGNIVTRLTKAVNSIFRRALYRMQRGAWGVGHA